MILFYFVEGGSQNKNHDHTHEATIPCRTLRKRVGRYVFKMSYITQIRLHFWDGYIGVVRPHCTHHEVDCCQNFSLKRTQFSSYSRSYKNSLPDLMTDLLTCLNKTPEQKTNPSPDPSSPLELLASVPHPI